VIGVKKIDKEQYKYKKEKILTTQVLLVLARSFSLSSFSFKDAYTLYFQARFTPCSTIVGIMNSDPINA